MKDSELFVKKIIKENYDIGEVVNVSEIKEGDTNNSFMAETERDGVKSKWYVRQYNPSEEERDIIFEHAFEKYLKKHINGEIQSIMPLETKAGGTWIVDEFKGQSNFYAVFNTISGREPYSWEYNNLSENALESCAEITAKFHAWGYGFEAPEGSGKSESPLEEQFGEWKDCFRNGLAEKQKEPEVFRRFNEYFEKEVDVLCEASDFCASEFEKHKHNLKKCVNHKDLNPGNVMFDEDDRINAVFDMDWCNYDYRLYDIGWMGYQAIASWDVNSWGEVPVEKLQRFIDTYNKVMIERGCPLGPLNEDEIEFLPVMIIAGALKVLADFVCYEDHRDEVHRMFVNTWRFVESVKFMMNYVQNK